MLHYDYLVYLLDWVDLIIVVATAIIVTEAQIKKSLIWNWSKCVTYEYVQGC